MVVALNLNGMMKRVVLGRSWVSKRMKAVRFSLIALPGRVLKRSHDLIIRISKGHPSLETLLRGRETIKDLVFEPSG
ncbi:MAG: hypothetical protein JW808_08060 [Victivallales bacterium]|nr:hypothetical protein [Victivallales bacterium]